MLGVETYNFYSTGEEVVENPGSSETVNGSLADMTWELMKTAIGRGELGRHAWVAQEIAKGSDSPFIVPVMGLPHGGWGYNQAYIDTSDPFNQQLPSFQETMALSRDTLRVKPYFMRFEETDDLFAYDGSVLHAPDGDTAASNEAAKSGTQYKLLAEAIPARSFGVAANSVDDLTELFNLNMMNLKNPGHWPEDRPLLKNSPTERQWWHSDFRVVALNYTWPMWKRMIDLGGLVACDGC